MSYAESEYIISEIRNGLPQVMGAGIPPKNVDFTVVSRDNKFFLRWIAANTILEGKTICVPDKVVFKVSRGVNNDGSFDSDDTFSAEITVSGAEFWNYSEEAYIWTHEDLIPGNVYTFDAITYSDQNVANLVQNSKTCSFSDKPPLEIYGFHQDFTNLDPDTSITWVKDNKDFTTPVHGNDDTGRVTLGSWASWYWLEQCKPYWLDKNGDVAYALNPNDYRQKLDGSPSDVGNPDAEGGAFVWIPKLYYKEIYAADGNSRDVYFSNTNDDDETKDFVNYVFNDANGKEVQGFWFPMFYHIVDDRHSLVVSGETCKMLDGYGGTNVTEYTGPYMLQLSNSCVPGLSSNIYKAIYLDGSTQHTIKSEDIDQASNKSAFDNYIRSHCGINNIPNRIGYATLYLYVLIRDIAWMISRTTNSRNAFGYGIAHSYDMGNLYDSDTLTHGGFYGLGTVSKKACKLFHSVLFGTHAMQVADFTTAIYYATSSSGAMNRIVLKRTPFGPISKTNTVLNNKASVMYNTNFNKYSSKLKQIDQALSLPWPDSSGSSSTGLTDMSGPLITKEWIRYVNRIALFGALVQSTESQVPNGPIYNFGISSVGAINYDGQAGWKYPTLAICIAPPSTTYKPI